MVISGSAPHNGCNSLFPPSSDVVNSDPGLASKMVPQDSESLKKSSAKHSISSTQLFGIVDDLSFQMVKSHIASCDPILTQVFGQQVQTRLVQLLIQLDQIGFKAIYLLKAAQLLGVSHSSIDRVVRELVDENIVTETGVGRRRYFRLNQRNPVIQQLCTLHNNHHKKSKK